jgi:hypothetical protein
MSTLTAVLTLISIKPKLDLTPVEFLSEQATKLYSNIRGKMEKWSSLVSKEKDAIVVKEIDAVFNLLSNFGNIRFFINITIIAFNMVSLGVDVETIRRFMMKMCNVTGLDEERSKTLMQLVSNMTRASELLDESIVSYVLVPFITLQ